ncbi:MAG TPA: HAD family hydrolase [Ruminiclostridium sp.]|nr:HAD family hydrolase [Ruminiclostridium sp.]
MPRNLIVFDLDGTLNKTENYAVPAILNALRQLGATEFDRQDVIDTFGARDEDTIVKFFGDRAQEVEKEFWQKVSSFVENSDDLYKPYDGTEGMLKALKKSGCLLAICSNAGLDYIAKTAKRLKIEDYFDFYQELVPGLTKADTLCLLLKKVKPDKAVMVGDRYFDKDAAVFNNIPFVGCVYGYGNINELEGADYLINTPLELIEVVLNRFI